MTIKFRISEKANFWHFMSNLFNWHDSVRLYYKDYWLGQTGTLTKREEGYLEKLGDFFKKYNYGKKYWGQTLLLENDNIWEKARQNFTKSELTLLKKIFEIFYPRFKKIWEIDQYLLRVWKVKLERTSKKFITKLLIDDLNSFFNIDLREIKVTIILLLCDKRFDPVGGGANLGKGYVALELSRADYDAIRPAWLIFWHELTHNLWEEDSFIYQQLRRNLSDQIKAEGLEGKILHIPVSRIINEAVVDSLFPKGYLAKKHFNFPIDTIFQRFTDGKTKKFNIEDWHYYFAFYLKDIAKDYIEKSRPLDSDFFEEIKRYYVKFIKDY